MSRTLNLVDHALALGRKYQDLGRQVDAIRVFTRLTRLPDLPPEAAAEVRGRLADLLVKRRQFARARRHLVAVLALQPDNASYHHLLGSAVENDPAGDPKRALVHYRRAMTLEPDNPVYLCDFGRLAMEAGGRRLALDALRQAAALAPDDLAVLAQLVSALRQSGRTAEARGLLLSARFRHPRDARFHKLWNDFQFQVLKTAQERTRTAAFWGDQPVVLSFTTAEPRSEPTAAPAARVLRHDERATRPSSPHHLPSAPLPRRKQAQ